MRRAENLLGVWAPPAMYDPGAGCYDILAFHEDGSGFLDFSDHDTKYFCERFRWTLEAPATLRLRGEQIQSFSVFSVGGSTTVERPSTLDALVSFTITTEATSAGRRTQVLRLGACPWSALADPTRAAARRYQAHDPTCVLFRAACFERPDEKEDRVFRGKALSDFLAERLRTKRLSVGERQRVFMGACYAREVRIGGLGLILSVNWDWDFERWWVCVRPPPVGGKVEMDDLCETLREILVKVEGLTDVAWYAEGDWAEMAVAARK